MASVGLADIGASSNQMATNAGAKKLNTESVTPWSDRILDSIAKSRKVRGGNYVQIATVDSHGHPRCRTVVFRGFEAVAERGGREAMRMITDARSEKMVHVSTVAPHCELVWWFSKTSEQFRVAGELEMVGADCASAELLACRKQQWGNLSDNAREQFFWGAPPGLNHCSDVAFPDPPPGGRSEDGKVVPPPDTFVVMLLWPRSVKYLRLTDNFSQKDDFDETEGSWAASRVNP
eukprot:CAMPEP_0171610698 /NCGR_PEP_ID=MMETSP0990-20121206/10201_1 /TAXON_ID=483369 /ORGANISM="non described non described, Strain CCMP2098" /LENGTH=233 /DNA_ID=CAMNT_0012174151 /DNA_START=101 /DNA_END=802 /DNA_ORIENTATION=+